MQKVFYGQVLGIIFSRLSETEKETDTVAPMTVEAFWAATDKKLGFKQL